MPTNKMTGCQWPNNPAATDSSGVSNTIKHETMTCMSHGARRRPSPYPTKFHLLSFNPGISKFGSHCDTGFKE